MTLIAHDIIKQLKINDFIIRWWGRSEVPHRATLIQILEINEIKLFGSWQNVEDCKFTNRSKNWFYNKWFLDNRTFLLNHDEVVELLLTL